jgi:HlyD family secretion protein
MPRPSPRLLIPLAVVTALSVGGWYVDRKRAETRSVLSGFFESQPGLVSSRVAGRVERIAVHEGDSVHAGQTLLTLETKPTRAENAARHAQAEQARAQAAEVVHGPRTEDIERQRGTVREAEAALAKLRAGPLPDEIASARARLRQAAAMSEKARRGPRPQEIAGARAAERVAHAKLAAAERGLTNEEKEQLRARLELAKAQEDLARRDVERMEILYKEGAISRQEADRAQTNLSTAQSRTRDAAEALRRAEDGTPPEEMDQARESWRQAKAALDLVLAGTRREDIAAANAERDAARHNLDLLLRGTRIEDIRAGEARLAQARAALDALLAGSRKEDIRQAQANARAAALTARSSDETLRERVVRAPSDGIIERILVAEGDLLSANTPVARLADPNDIWVRVYVPESRLAAVRAGSPVTLRVDGVPGTLDAVVESVAQRGEFTPANLQTPDERGKQVFGVRIRLRSPDLRVKAGMYATVTSLGGASAP